MTLNKSWATSANRALDFDIYSTRRGFGLGFDVDWNFSGDHAPEIGFQLTVANFTLEVRSYDIRHATQREQTLG